MQSCRPPSSPIAADSNKNSRERCWQKELYFALFLHNDGTPDNLGLLVLRSPVSAAGTLRMGEAIGFQLSLSLACCRRAAQLHRHPRFPASNMRVTVPSYLRPRGSPPPTHNPDKTSPRVCAVAPAFLAVIHTPIRVAQGVPAVSTIPCSARISDSHEETQGRTGHDHCLRR